MGRAGLPDANFGQVRLNLVKLETFTNCLIFTRIIFKKIARLMGGRIRGVMSGGAPLAPDTHEQIQTCLCVEMVQGYGLTETTAGAAVTDSKMFT